jgi:hypothetical protein
MQSLGGEPFAMSQYGLSNSGQFVGQSHDGNIMMHTGKQTLGPSAESSIAFGDVR